MKIVSSRHLLIMFGAFAVGLIAAFFWVRIPMTALTPECLAAARAKWDRAGIQSYDASYLMHGSAYDVKVRDGIVMEVLVDGRPATSADVRSYSMPGLFDLLELELENMSDPNGPFRFGLDTVVARVRFHPEYGYVERYLRSGGGQHRGASVELTAFVRR